MPVLIFIVAVLSSEHHLDVMQKQLRTEHTRSLILSNLVASYCNHNKAQIVMMTVPGELLLPLLSLLNRLAF
jgi:hypothetical protein